MSQPQNGPEPKKIKLRYRRIADRYLVNGMNATEAYNYVYRPKNPQNSHSLGCRIVAMPSVRAYIEQKLEELNELDYSPEAIKTALANKARSAKRDSDSIRALELMAKIAKLLDEGGPSINLISGDTIDAMRRRLSEQRKMPQNVDDNQVLSPQVYESKDVTTPMSHNIGYGDGAKSVLGDTIVSDQDANDKGVNNTDDVDGETTPR